MRSGILVSLFVVALCACATAAERPALFSRGDIIIAAEDPNGVVPPAGGDPNQTWDPATHLAADWEYVSVSMTSRLYNPATKPDAKAEGPQWSMSLAGTMDIIDSNGLIGWSLTPTSVLALDQNGAVVVSSTPSNSPTRIYRQPRSRSVPPGFPSSMLLDRVSLSLPIDPNVAYPKMFSRVEWTMNVLVAEEVKTVDIPFKTSDKWVELTPGMEIMVEQATVEAGKYQYRIKVRYDRQKVDYLLSGTVALWRDQQAPAAAVLAMDVLNAEGKSMQSLGGNFSGGSGYSGGGSNDQITGTASGSGSCAACGDAATIRYTLAFNMHELEARMALENIPVPEF